MESSASGETDPSDLSQELPNEKREEGKILPDNFSFRARAKTIETLETPSAEVDVLVLGCGVMGAGTALDAASRGLSVVVIEQNDFGSGTSSKSSKIFHGGIRYLHQKTYGLVFEALRERSRLIEIAPDLANPLPFVFPIYREGKQPLEDKERISYYAKTFPALVKSILRWTVNPASEDMMKMAKYPGMLKISMMLYDILSWIGEHFVEGNGRMRRHQMLSRDELIQEEPFIKKDGLAFGARYWDGFAAAGDVRITLQTIKTAQKYGAKGLNYCEAVDFIYGDNGKIRGARVKDKITGTEFKIQAKKVINASGPWVDKVRGLAGARENTLRPTKGSHIIVTREKLPVNNAIVMEGADGRLAFIIPWDEHVIIGTTDTDYQGDPGEVNASKEDIAYLLKAANNYYPDVNLAPDDIISTYAGLRPLMVPNRNVEESATSREHSISESEDGLITIAGGKLTTYRSMTKELMDKVASSLKSEFGMNVPESSTDKIPLKRGLTKRIDNKDIPEDIRQYLFKFYGKECEQIWELMRHEPQLKERLVERLPHTLAEVRYSVEHEQAMALSDVLMRRTNIFLKAEDQGLAVARQVAEYMKGLMGKDETWGDEQVEVYEREVGKSREWRAGKKLKN